MKLPKIAWPFICLLATSPAWGLTAGTRSVFLNGVDISSAKNQSMQQVNIKIDSQGNVYIEAPQYEAQQETTFVPLGRRQPLPGAIPQHRAPGPLPQRIEPASQAELAPAEETKVEQGSAAEKSDGDMLKKEGVRVPADGSNKQPGSETGSNTSPNQPTRQ